MTVEDTPAGWYDPDRHRPDNCATCAAHACVKAELSRLREERDALRADYGDALKEVEAQQFPVETVARLEQEREGYKRDFLAARERSEIQETRLRMLQEAVSEYLAYPTLAGRRERLELILADLNPDGGSKGFSGGA